MANLIDDCTATIVAQQISVKILIAARIQEKIDFTEVPEEKKQETSTKLESPYILNITDKEYIGTISK